MAVPIAILVLVIATLAVGFCVGFIVGTSLAFRQAAQAQNSNRRFEAWLTIAIGGSFLVVAAGVSIHTWRFISTAERTTGTVTEMRMDTNRQDGGTATAPVFSFRDSADVEHSAASKFYSSPSRHPVGDTVPVLFRADYPQGARIDSTTELWGLPTVFGLLGGAIMVVGFTMLNWARIKAHFA